MEWQQRIFASLFEMRQVLNGPQNDEMKKVQIKEKCQAILKECG